LAPEWESEARNFAHSPAALSLSDRIAAAVAIGSLEIGARGGSGSSQNSLRRRVRNEAVKRIFGGPGCTCVRAIRTLANSSKDGPGLGKSIKWYGNGGRVGIRESAEDGVGLGSSFTRPPLVAQSILSALSH
jgi:hypothetical protein